jgi:hypothetical protein
MALFEEVLESLGGGAYLDRLKIFPKEFMVLLILLDQF